MTTATAPETTTPKTTTARRARPAKKAGNPQADKAAAPAAPAAPKPTHGYVLVNGDFRVHKNGCRKMAADLKESDYAEAATATWTTEEAAIRDLWSDIIGDEVNQEKDGPVPASYLAEHGLVGATAFHACCKLEPFEIPSAKITARTAKRELATYIVEAVAASLGEFDVNEETGLSNDDIRKLAAHWLHHLPADRERWVASGLPKPDRSDWR